MDEKIKASFFRLLRNDKVNIAKAIHQKVTLKYCPNLFDKKSEKVLLFVFETFFKDFGESIDSKQLPIFLDQKSKKMTPDEKRDVIFLYESLGFEPVTENIDFILEALKQEYIKGELGILEEKIVAVPDINNKMTLLRDTTHRIDLLKRKDIYEGGVISSIDETKAAYNYKEANPMNTGLQTGFPTIDRVLGGLDKSKLYMVTAPEKVGKSMFLLNLAYNINKLGHDVLYITLENSRGNMLDRYHSLHTGLALTKIRRVKLDSAEKDKYFKDMEQLKLDRARGTIGELYICDIREACSADLLNAKYKELSGLYDFKIILLDYLSLMVPANQHRDDKGWEQLDKITKEVRDFARVIDLPIFTAGQFNAEGIKESKKGVLDSINMAKGKNSSTHLDLHFGMAPIDAEAHKHNPTYDLKMISMNTRDSQYFELLLKCHAFRMKMEEMSSGVSLVPDTNDVPID